MSISVSIVEDDTKVRESLARLIDGSPGYQCASAHASGESALAEIPKVKPNVILMDINLTGINGVECARQLKPLLPNTQIIMLTVYQNTEHIFDALAAGATGYMLKQTKPDKLLVAVKDVYEGGSPMSSHIARKIVQSFQQQSTQNTETPSLSPREAQVIELLAKGYLYKEVADTMGVSYATIHTHIRHIYEKLQVRSRTEAVVKHLSQMRRTSEDESFMPPSLRR
ncbi:MAG TPA: response regulator transcription factor [Pseudomonadales bacterium]|nr:response regulator transcription factor [Pseudomonadales bacterium]